MWELNFSMWKQKTLLNTVCSVLPQSLQFPSGYKSLLTCISAIHLLLQYLNKLCSPTLLWLWCVWISCLHFSKGISFLFLSTFCYRLSIFKAMVERFKMVVRNKIPKHIGGQYTVCLRPSCWIHFTNLQHCSLYRNMKSIFPQALYSNTSAEVLVCVSGLSIHRMTGLSTACWLLFGWGPVGGPWFMFTQPQ